MHIHACHVEEERERRTERDIDGQTGWFVFMQTATEFV